MWPQGMSWGRGLVPFPATIYKAKFVNIKRRNTNLQSWWLKKKTKRSQWLIEHKDTHTHKSIRVFKLEQHHWHAWFNGSILSWVISWLKAVGRGYTGELWSLADPAWSSCQDDPSLPYLALFPKCLRDQALLRTAPLQLLPELSHFFLHAVDLLRKFQQQGSQLCNSPHPVR